MNCLDIFFDGQPDKWKSFYLFHSELQERLTDLWQAGLTFSAGGYITDAQIGRELDTCLRIGKLPNPCKEDSTPNTVKALPFSTQYGFLLAWSTINELESDRKTAMSMSRNVLCPAYVDVLAKNLITLFRHDNPQAMTKEMFNLA